MGRLESYAIDNFLLSQITCLQCHNINQLIDDVLWPNGYVYVYDSNISVIKQKYKQQCYHIYALCGLLTMT